MGLDAQFWQGRRVLVTGHTGFKGSWLCLWLESLGADVCGYSLAPPTDPSLFELAQVDRGMQSVLGDICDQHQLNRTIAEFEPEVILHLAAQSLVRQSYLAPVETLTTNITGTTYLLEAARKTPSVRSVVVVTTDKCYENQEWPWPYRECEPLGGHDPYSASKACVEIVTQSFRRSFGTSHAGIATARAGNVIGGGDWATDRIVPDAVRAFAAGEPLLVRNPSAIRPWQHVLEPLAGYLQLAQALANNSDDYSGAWNFGPGDNAEQTVGALVTELADMWDDCVWYSPKQPHALHEAHTLKLDSSKARQMLGWSPIWNLTESVRATAEWYRNAVSPELPIVSLRDLSLLQIEEYQKQIERTADDEFVSNTMSQLPRRAA